MWGLIFVAIAVFGYLYFNVVIWKWSADVINMGLMNILAGVVNLGIALYRNQKHPVRWKAAWVGSLGIITIVAGLRGAYALLLATTVVSLNYDLVVIAIAFFFWVIPNRWGPGLGTRPDSFDLRRHLAFLTLIIGRFCLHWTGQENYLGFAFVALSVCGYLLFNLSIKLSQGERRTNSAMNICGGIALVVYGCIWQTESLSRVSLVGALLGASAILFIVFGLGQGYNRLRNPSLVGGLVYDALMTFGPLVFLIFTAGSFILGDWLITCGCLFLMLDRYFYHERRESLIKRWTGSSL